MPNRPTLAVALALACACAAAAQEIQYLSTEEALALEHETRFKRMRRIAGEFGVVPAPEFRDYQVPASALPADFPHAVPVLRIIFPENTFFDTGSAALKAEARAIVRAMAAMLDGDVPDVTVFVAGHADARGGEIMNHNLSIARARAVAELLNDLRGRPGPVWSIGFGKSIPLYPNTTDANLGFNRRVELLLAARVEAVATWLSDQAGDVCRTPNAVERVRCLTAFRQERKVFEAEEVVPKRRVRLAEQTIKVAPTSSARQRVQAEGGVQRVQTTAPPKIRIQLNERRIYVKSIEH